MLGKKYFPPPMISGIVSRRECSQYTRGGSKQKATAQEVFNVILSGDGNDDKNLPITIL